MSVTYWPKEQQVGPEDSRRPSPPFIRFIGREETDEDLVEYFSKDPLPDFIIAPPVLDTGYKKGCRDSSTCGWTLRHMLSKAGVDRDSCDVGIWFCGFTRRERAMFYDHCLQNDYCMVIPSSLVVEGGRVYDRRRIISSLTREISMEPGIFILPSFSMDDEADLRTKEVINEMDGDWEVLL